MCECFLRYETANEPTANT
ncbi:hypothetical protein A2U01_0116575, partial [Trifolium medium]|nr:hypothetical protein [Trifolium medium]